MHHDFRSYLTELYDKPFRVVKKVEAPDHAAYHYTDGDEADPKADYLVINFGYIQPQDEGWDMDFTRGGSTALTGGGKATQVFATVMDGFKRFVKRYAPKTVSFTAAKSEVNAKTYSYSSGSRVKLYNLLIKRYAAQAGYRLESTKSLGMGRELFVLERIAQ
jgi:hypothetical protein